MELGVALQDELHSRGLTGARRWDQDVFTPSGFTMQSLTDQAQVTDFAVLIATPDDVGTSRDTTYPVTRDNVIFELGLFVGAIGRERTYLLADTSTGLKLPSDLSGLNRLPYYPPAGHDYRLAVTPAASQIVRQARKLGPRVAAAPQDVRLDDSLAALRREIELVCANARAQGWVVRTNSDSTLRLQPPGGRKRPPAFSIGTPTVARAELRDYVRMLRSYGLRINNSVRRPID